ncbi:MAG: molybdopterin-dependent oxidoreductase [Christensenellales bacterium]|jgi:hypothetical protein
MMKTKGLLLLVVLMMVAAVFVACAPQEKAEWTISIEGASKAEFSSNDYLKLKAVTIDTVLKKKDGSEKNETWEGVLLKDVLEYLGVSEYTSVTMEASDGYAKDYTSDIVNDEKTILGTKVNGEALLAEGGFVKAVAGNESGNMWIKELVKIKVNK